MLGRAAAQQCYLEALRLDMLYAPAWRGLGDLLRESGELVQVRAASRCSYQLLLVCVVAAHVYAVLVQVRSVVKQLLMWYASCMVVVLRSLCLLGGERPA
jgi:hypothetical protein